MSVKHVSLVVLTVQNSALILTMRYSRVQAGPRYRVTTAVLLSECLKSILSFVILINSRSGGTGGHHRDAKPDATSTSTSAPSPAINHSIRRRRSILAEIFSRRHGFFSMLIPAILYTVQNNLQYIAATNLDAATFQVTYQAKIIATAFFAVLILRQKLTPLQWIAIAILTAGVVLISYPTISPVKMSRSRSSETTQALGLLAVGAACLTSGFAGVYLEYLLKKVKDNHTQSGLSMIWIRNVQLCIASMIIAAIAAVMIDGPSIRHDGFLYGYNSVVWATILLQAGGGIVVALVIIFADNILKNFATTISTVISTAVSVMMGDCSLTMTFVGGVMLVLTATNLYSVGTCSRKHRVSLKEKGEEVFSHVQDAEKRGGFVVPADAENAEVNSDGLLTVEESHEKICM